MLNHLNFLPEWLDILIIVFLMLVGAVLILADYRAQRRQEREFRQLRRSCTEYEQQETRKRLGLR